MRHIPRKRFGQNFLEDPSAIAKIVAAIHPQASDHIIEIGPGMGALTRPLAKVTTQLELVEIDRDIVQELKTQYSAQQVVIHEADVLKFDFSKLGGNLRIVGNLPYNISTPLLFHLIAFNSNIKDLHVMLQKEVVTRMVANPSTAEYSKLSVMLQYRFAIEWLFTIAPASFRPSPKVESAFVRLIPITPGIVAKDETLFSQVVFAAFAKRRKTLLNNLREFFSVSDFNHLGIDAQERAQDLPLENFVTMANYLHGRKRVSEMHGTAAAGLFKGV